MHGFVGVVGFMGGTEAQVALTQIILKRVRVQGISVASLEQHERMIAALEATQLQPALDQIYGFEELGTAMEHMLAGKHFGKVGIDFTR